MKRSLMMTTAVMMVSGTMALAQTNPKVLGDKYILQGFDFVDVRVGPTQIRVEAFGNGQEVETIYDRATGNVLEVEVYSFEGRPNGSGVRVRDANEDFLDDDDITDGIDGPSDDNDMDNDATDGIDGPSDNGNDDNDGTDGNDGPSDNDDNGNDDNDGTDGTDGNDD